MIIIGIDMSKNSPGVCVRHDSSLTFMSFIRGDEGGRLTKSKRAIIDHFTALRKLGVTITTNPRSTGKLEYSDSEIWKLEDASLLAKTIVDSLPLDADMIGMEGFSYGSKGNAGLDIAGYAYCVRNALYEKYGTERLCIFSPGNVKKKAGKGNAGKEEIMEFFLNSQHPDLQNDPFWNALKSGIVTCAKPVDDLIDSFFVQECALERFKLRNKDTIIHDK